MQQEIMRPHPGDPGPEPFTVDMMCAARKNPFFRKALWTGEHLQVTLMCIPPCGEIGLEVHPETDQFLRLEAGQGLAVMGPCRERLTFRRQVNGGDAVLVPAGTWHNLINTGRIPLKLYSVYAPPHHPRGVLHRTKAEADAEED